MYVRAESRPSEIWKDSLMTLERIFDDGFHHKLFLILSLNLNLIRIQDLFKLSLTLESLYLRNE
jgi:hypothetical protein